MTLPRTLRFRIVVASAALSALAVIAVSVWVLQDARTRGIRALETRVSDEAAVIQASATSMQDLAASADAVGDAISGRMTVYNADGAAIADSAGPPAAVATLAEPGVFSAAPDVKIESDKTLGGDAVVAVARLDMPGRVTAFVRLAAPLSEVDTALSSLRRNAVVGGILAVAAATVFATVLAGRLTRTIGTITAGARIVAAGDLEHRLRPEPPLEVEQLAAAFNEMAAKLSQLIAQEASERERLASILSTMSDGVLVVDSAGTVEVANPAAIEMLDAPAGFQSGDRLISLNHNYELNRLATDAAESGESGQAQIELLGPRRYLQALAVPLTRRAADETTRRALVLLTDLTEMRRVETTRREFVSNASHELRTPIAAISALVETLQAGAINDPQAAGDFLRRIGEDTARMDRMVSELLELSRLESGQERLSMLPVNPAEALGRTVDHFRAQAERGKLHLSVDVDPSLPLITADREKLDQVLSNLLSNAIRATPAGGVVAVTAGRATDGVEFRVSDTGGGIPPEHLPHVFERFYKADRSRSDDGAGLGLAIARHVVEIHGGDIFVDSTPGEGTTFTVFLPASPTGPRATSG